MLWGFLYLYQEVEGQWVIFLLASLFTSSLFGVSDRPSLSGQLVRWNFGKTAASISCAALMHLWGVMHPLPILLAVLALTGVSSAMLSLCIVFFSQSVDFTSVWFSLFYGSWLGTLSCPSPWILLAVSLLLCYTTLGNFFDFFLTDIARAFIHIHTLYFFTVYSILFRSTGNFDFCDEKKLSAFGLYCLILVYLPQSVSHLCFPRAASLLWVVSTFLATLVLLPHFSTWCPVAGLHHCILMPSGFVG